MTDLKTPHTSRILRPRIGRILRIAVIYTVFAFLIVIPVRYFVAQPFLISGTSMEPSFNVGDYVVIDRLSYHLDQPQRGDIIVFHYPLDPSIYFVKRIIGLPGDIVELDGATISVHSEGDTTKHILPEPYLVFAHKDNKPSSITLASDEYFVLGDNRDVSADSREWGPLQRKFIVGRVFARLWPMLSVEK